VFNRMDFMLAAAVAAITNLGLLGIITYTFIQNMRLVKSYFTYGLTIVSALFIIQNIVFVVFWSNLYVAVPSIKNIFDPVAPFLFVINLAHSSGLAVLLWVTRK
jgi:hypothetical protein